MNNLNSPANFENSPIASPMAPNLNASMPMLGGGRKRHRKSKRSKRSKKGGMFEPDTPEKDRGSRVSPLSEKTPLTDLMDDENSIENAKDDEYENLEKEIIDDNKMVDDSYKIDVEEEKINNDNDSDNILDKLERGVDVKARGGSRRRRKRRSKKNKTKKLSKKTKKNKKKGSHNKKTRKTRRK